MSLIWSWLLFVIPHTKTSPQDPQQSEATSTMFCTKLKDLKITGECPFSLLAPGQVPKEPAEDLAGSSESCKATLPICQDVPEKNAQGSLPKRKTSRSRVYLHTLAESICKLIFPEVSACPFMILLILWKLFKKSFSKEDVNTCFLTLKTVIDVAYFLETYKNIHLK